MSQKITTFVITEKKDGSAMNISHKDRWGRKTVTRRESSPSPQTNPQKTILDENDMSENMYCYEYPHPAVTTDCAIFCFDQHRLQVLLIERGNEPYKGKWAFPGGFLNPDESAEQGALRELKEETGLDGAYVEQLHTYSTPNRDPRERVITIAYYALVRKQEVHASDDAAKAQWFPIDEIPPLAFDHDRMMRDAMHKLRERLILEPIGLQLLPETFTMNEVQLLYEAILGTQMDDKKFSQKMTQDGLLIPVNAMPNETTDKEHTTPLYSFDKERYHEIKKNGLGLEFLT